MAPLTDPDRRAAYLDAFRNWQVRGYVEFSLSEQSYRWIAEELEGVSLTQLKGLLHEYVVAEKEIDEVAERRMEWSDKYEFHYDLRLTVQGVRVYVETRLHYRLPIRRDASWIEIVNIHAP